MQQDRAQDPGAAALLLVGALALPWLNPTAGGPSAVIQPWLIAAAATVLAWHVVAPTLTRAHLGLALAAIALLAATGRAEPPVMLAVGGLLVIAVSAAVASASAARPWIAQAVVDAWLAAALASSVIALVQYFGFSAQLAPLANTTEAGEAFANLRQRNQFATLASIGVAAVLWKVHRGARLSWALPAVLLLVVANAATASRTGALQIAVLVGLTLWWQRAAWRSAGAVCLVAALGYAVAAVALPFALEQLTGVSAPNAWRRLVASDGCGSRALMWANVLHLIAQKPWLGWGWGELDFAHFATLYPGARFCDILDNAHSLPLHLAVELGVPVAVIVCAGFAAWLLRRRPWREPDPTRQLAWTVLAAILLHSLLEYPLWYGPFQMAAGLCLGLLAQPRPRTAATPVGPAGRVGVSVALTLALVYTAWDYHIPASAGMTSERMSSRRKPGSIVRCASSPRSSSSRRRRRRSACATRSTTRGGSCPTAWSSPRRRGSPTRGGRA